MTDKFKNGKNRNRINMNDREGSRNASFFII